jgi:tetratricopeptide (TPR) repeat protein
MVLHRVRCLVALGRLEEARQVLAGLGDGESWARRLLVALVSVRRGDGASDFAAWATRVTQSEVHLNGLFNIELPAVVGSHALRRGLQSPQDLARLLEDVLERMAGNLGPSPTVAAVAADGTRGFVPLALPPTSRAKAAHALASLRWQGPDAAEADLVGLLARRPWSVHTLCYLGELHLWRGHYAEALRSFRATRRLEPARWADIGTVAALMLTERYARALAMVRLAERRFPPIVAGTLPVYRGALRRRTGDLDGAIDDLREALAAKPSRTGARIELCLALRARGLRGEATAVAADLVRDAVPLLVDAADTVGLDWLAEPPLLVGDDVLRAALRAMRGNRSSMITTWIASDGAMRALPDRDTLQPQAKRLLDGLREGNP